MALMLDSYAYDYQRNKAVHMWNHGIMRSKFKQFGMPWCFECHSTLVSMLKAYVPDPLISVVIHCDVPLSSLQATLWSVANQAGWHEQARMGSHQRSRCHRLRCH